MIDKNIQKSVDEMSQINEDMLIDERAVADPNAIVPESVFSGDEVKVAGVRGLIKLTLKDSLKGKKIIPAEIQAGSKLKQTTTTKVDNVAETTSAIDDVPVKPKEDPIGPVTEEQLGEIVARQEEMLDKGVLRTAPSPTINQQAEGVLQGRLNTTKTTEERLRALDLSQQEVLRGSKEVKRTTISELRDEIRMSGLDSKELNALTEGKPLTAKISDYDLTKKIVVLKEMHDVNAKVISNTIDKLGVTGLDDVEKYNLLVLMQENSNIAQTISGAGTEIATAMNAFKRIERLGPNVELSDIKDVVDSNMQGASFDRFINMYLKSPDIKAKNRLVNSTGGDLSSWMDSAYYTYQSNLLMSPTTWFDNLIGSTMHGALMSVEDVISVPIGKARRAINKKRGKPEDLPQDIVLMDDVLNGFTGMWDGMQDGFRGAWHVIKTGERAGYKGDKFQQLTSKNNRLMNAIPDELKVNNPFTQVAHTLNMSILKNMFVGKAIDATGFVQSVPMRMLAAGDEIVGNTFSRMALNREASVYIRNRTKELRALGTSDDATRKILTKEVEQFVTEQPAEIYATTKGVKDIIQFTYKWDQTKRLDRTFSNVNKFLNRPMIRFMVPFSNTLTKIADQTVSRIPGLNFISPQFFKDIGRGGKYTDRAIARLTTGAMGMGGAYFAASNNKLTGSGPSDYQQKTALQRTGWQPYALKYKKTGMSDENKAKLGELTTLTEDDEYYYISYQRFDMVAQILGMGADMNDAMRFSREDPTSEWEQELFMAYATSSSEFMKNIPVMQFVGEMTDIAGGHYQDEGDKLVDLFTRLSVSAGKAATLSVPGASIAQSTLGFQAAKTIDKEKAETDPATRIGYGRTEAASVILEKIYNSVIERTPVLRGELNKQLDAIGRPIYNKNTIIQHWANVIPFVRMSETIASPMDDLLQEYYTGISIPGKSWGGVKLGGDDMNEFKKLSGQTLMMGIANSLGDEEFMNLEKAIVQVVETEKQNAEELGEYYAPGDARKDIAATVNMYRSEAKRRMLGDVETPENRDEVTGISRYTGEWEDEDTGEIHKAFNIKLSNDINYYNGFKHRSLNP